MSLLPVYSLAVWTLMAPLLVAIWDWVATQKQLRKVSRPRGHMAIADDYINRVALRR